MPDDFDLTRYEVIAVEPQPCVTDQWNFPYDRAMPWASDGICSICGQSVEMVRIGPDRPNIYSHIAKPHTRLVTWYKVKDHDLLRLLRY